MVTRLAKSRWMWLISAALLVAAVVLMYWRLLLTNRVLASGDVFTYFTPYRDYANTALRSGRLPLWNPYLFLGVPFLANPQAGVLYPLHWPFVGLEAARSLIASMALHVWLAGMGMLVYARRTAGLSWLAALGAAVVFSLGGFLGARAGQINQLSGVAWLPWMFWLLEETDHAASKRWSRSLVGLAGLSLAIALLLLAGHTQTAFINLAGLGLAAIWPGVAAVSTWTVARLRRSPATLDKRALAAVARRLGLMALATGLAVLLAAPQLLPTFELSRQSIRAEGLAFREAVSFSLRPTHLLLSLLPTYGENLADQFGTPAFAEFVAYVGVVALVLAVFGVVAARRRQPKNLVATPVGLATALAGVGVALAFGLYNPLTFVLYTFVPGFDLFRAPARWMILAVFGVSVLAGFGLQAVPMRVSRGATWPKLHRTWGWIVAVGAAVVVLALALVQQWPGPATLLGWLLLGVAAVLVSLSRMAGIAARLVLLGLLMVELTAASLALEHTRPTAPEAVTSLRSAPAHLLASARQDQAQGRLPGRFLSLSGITYDPGDLAEIEQLLGPQLPPQAVYDFVVASKLQEIAAPNLPLLWRLPAVDGYDGGVLPLRRYVDLQTLFLPPESLAPDGRLREQLETVPAGRLLRLLGVDYIITDKGFDVWQDGVYYDLELSNRLQPGQEITLDHADRLEATEIGLFSHLDGGRDLPTGTPVAEVRVESLTGNNQTFIVRAGEGTAEGQWTAEVAHLQPAVTHPWPRTQAGWDYLDRRALDAPTRPVRLHVRNVAPAGAIVLRGVSLIDQRTGSHTALTLPADGEFQRVHSGDVKIYRSLEALPRAHVVGQARLVADDTAALATLGDESFEPAQDVILVEPEVVAAGLSGALQSIDPRAASGTVTATRDEPEHVTLQVDLPTSGVVVLSDSWYPGWRATIDGQPAPLVHANYLFKAVVVPPGSHEISLEFDPETLQTGRALAVAAGLVLVGLLVVAVIGAWRGSQKRQSQTLER